MGTIDIHELKQRATNMLEKKGYTEKSIGNFSYTWNALVRYMSERGISEYSSLVGSSFLENHFKEKLLGNLSKSDQAYIHRIRVLDNLIKEGSVYFRKKEDCPYVFDGDIGTPFISFLLNIEKTCSASTLRNYRCYLYQFYLFLRDSNLDLKKFNTQTALWFISYLEGKSFTTNKKTHIVEHVRVFVISLTEQGYIEEKDVAVWRKAFKTKYIHRPHVPAIYTEEEIGALLKAVNRGSNVGKRDYAMLLLAIRYGLRAGDIVGMRFSNINWEENVISFRQSKTGSFAKFDLTEEIGSAIADYLQFARPNVKDPHLFLAMRAPYGKISVGALESCVTKWMRYADIDFSDRRHGPHSLRHTLATRLLEAGTSMPVISEVLGHSTIESTKTYIRVNTHMLAHCALEVPFVANDFYSNIYGKD